MKQTYSDNGFLHRRNENILKEIQQEQGASHNFDSRNTERIAEKNKGSLPSKLDTNYGRDDTIKNTIVKEDSSNDNNFEDDDVDSDDDIVKKYNIHVVKQENKVEKVYETKIYEIEAKLLSDKQNELKQVEREYRNAVKDLDEKHENEKLKYVTKISDLLDF